MGIGQLAGRPPGEGVVTTPTDVIRRSRPPLSRGVVVREALTLIDDRGPGALTMRALGDRLHVEAMSLYTYVTGREDLLDGIVDHIVAQMQARPDTPPPAEAGWREHLLGLARTVRRTALQHPRAFPLVATRPPSAPWLRPPLRSLDFVEDLLDQLTGAGFTDDQALYTYRAFSSFLLGTLLLETAVAAGAAADADDVTRPAPSDLDESRYPTLARLREALAEDQAAGEFADGLDDLLDRVAAVTGAA